MRNNIIKTKSPLETEGHHIRSSTRTIHGYDLEEVNNELILYVSETMDKNKCMTDPCLLRR